MHHDSWLKVLRGAARLLAMAGTKRSPGEEGELRRPTAVIEREAPPHMQAATLHKSFRLSVPDAVRDAKRVRGTSPASSGHAVPPVSLHEREAGGRRAD